MEARFARRKRTRGQNVKPAPSPGSNPGRCERSEPLFPGPWPPAPGPLKLLLVHNAYQQAGGEDVVFEQERRLLERHGHQVAVYCKSNHEAASLSRIERITLAGRAVWSGAARAEFANLLARERPDVVHVHNTFMMISPSIFSACREAGVPVVQTLHNYRVACPAANFFRDGQVCEECLESGPWRSLRYGCYRESRLATAGSALVVAVHQRLGTWARQVDGFIALSEFSTPGRASRPNFRCTSPAMARCARNSKAKPRGAGLRTLSFTASWIAAAPRG